MPGLALHIVAEIVTKTLEYSLFFLKNGGKYKTQIEE